MVDLHINCDICKNDLCISCFRELRGKSQTRDDSTKREVEVHDHDNCDGLLKLKCTSILGCKHSGKGKKSRLGCKHYGKGLDWVVMNGQFPTEMTNSQEHNCQLSLKLINSYKLSRKVDRNNSNDNYLYYPNC